MAKTSYAIKHWTFSRHTAAERLNTRHVLITWVRTIFRFSLFKNILFLISDWFTFKLCTSRRDDTIACWCHWNFATCWRSDAIACWSHWNFVTCWRSTIVNWPHSRWNWLFWQARLTRLVGFCWLIRLGGGCCRLIGLIFVNFLLVFAHCSGRGEEFVTNGAHIRP